MFWYDQPSVAKDEPELEFFKHLPTTWDDTRVLSGEIGQHAVVARRSGEEWFVGCVNAGKPRVLEVPLDFLEEGRQYTAILYQHDPSVNTRTKVGITRRSVDATIVLKADLNAQGGMAVRIVP